LGQPDPSRQLAADAEVCRNPISVATSLPTKKPEILETCSRVRLRRYPLVIEKTATGYSAYSPEVPGCAAAGDTVEETRIIFHDALVALFEAMLEIGEPIPDSQSLVDYMEVAA